MYVSAYMKFAAAPWANQATLPSLWSVKESTAKGRHAVLGHAYSRSTLDKAGVRRCFSGWLHVVEKGLGRSTDQMLKGTVQSFNRIPQAKSFDNFS